MSFIVERVNVHLNTQTKLRTSISALVRTDTIAKTHEAHGCLVSHDQKPAKLSRRAVTNRSDVANVNRN